jgi:hypothetical protein
MPGRAGPAGRRPAPPRRTRAGRGPRLRGRRLSRWLSFEAELRSAAAQLRHSTSVLATPSPRTEWAMACPGRNGHQRAGLDRPCLRYPSFGTPARPRRHPRDSRGHRPRDSRGHRPPVPLVRAGSDPPATPPSRIGAPGDARRESRLAGPCRAGGRGCRSRGADAAGACARAKRPRRKRHLGQKTQISGRCARDLR